MVTFLALATTIPLKAEQTDIWNRLAFGASSRVVTASLIANGVLSAEQTSPETRTAMQALEESGGRGRYQWVRFKGKSEQDNKLVGVVEVTSPPRIPIYGSAFDEVFAELNAHRIPVFVNAHMGNVGGLVSVDRFGADAKAFFFITPRGGNLTVRHELQHIRDLVTRYSEFQKALPEVSPQLIALLERQEAGEVLSEREEKILDTVANHLVFGLGEARASEASLANLFSARGLAEMADPKTWPMEVITYISELTNTSVANLRLLYGLHDSELSYSSSELEITSKVLFFGAAGVSIPVAIAAGSIFTMNRLFPPAQKAGTGALRRSLQQCSWMVRSLLRRH